jgi:hypothetical protein
MMKVGVQKVKVSTPKDEIEKVLCDDVSTRSLLPPSPQCPIQLDQAAKFVASCARQRKFGSIKRSLTVQDLQVSRRSSPVAKGGNANRLLQVSDRILLANSHLMELVISDERVRNVAERSLNRLSICDEGLGVLRFGEMQIPTKPAAGENGLADLCTIRPDSDLCRKRTRERRTSAERSSARARQRHHNICRAR